MGRIRYGFKNLYYAVATDDGTGVLTYATPVQIPGAKSMSMAAAGDSMDEYADDGMWYHANGNTGYTGTIEFEDTAAADTFLETVLGATKDATTGLVQESSEDTPKEFAVLAQFTLAGGEEVGKRVCFYRVTAARPNVDAQTKEAGITVQTNTVNLTAMPRLNDNLVKAQADSSASAYTSWFEAVPELSTTITP